MFSVAVVAATRVRVRVRISALSSHVNGSSVNPIRNLLLFHGHAVQGGIVRPPYYRSVALEAVGFGFGNAADLLGVLGFLAVVVVFLHLSVTVAPVRFILLLLRSRL